MNIRHFRRIGFETLSEAELSDPEEMEHFIANLEILENNKEKESRLQ